MADKEKLSALMDGELVDKALIIELEQDQESQTTWKNYHLIGDVMRGEVSEQPEWNIADRVALALEDEPAHRALDAHKNDNFHRNDNVIELNEARLELQPTPQAAKRQQPTWLSQLGQVAIAACVSLAVILGVQQYGGTAPDAPQVEQVPVLQTIPFAGSVEPVSLTRDSVERSTNEVQLQEQHKRIHAMLRDHELQLRLNATALENEQSKSDIE